MAMKIIEATEFPNEYLYKIHIDDTKIDDAGKPLPEYIQEFKWGNAPPEGQTKAKYIANIKREMKLLCELKLSSLNGTPMADTGKVL